MNALDKIIEELRGATEELREANDQYEARCLGLHTPEQVKQLEEATCKSVILRKGKPVLLGQHLASGSAA